MSKKIVMLITSLLILTGCDKEVKEAKKVEDKETEVKVEEKVDIVDLESDSRPYAVIVNNYPDAVKVQTGLNDAYILYELPVEGGMTRTLALYKDTQTEKIGTVRSARHDFLDYVMENDAIFVHFGWSSHAEIEVPYFGINNINGLYDAPFWRENPEGLATEHTAYTSLVKCEETAKNKGYSLTTDVKPPINYSTKEIDLSVMENSTIANTIKLPYSYVYNVKFEYDSENKRYNRIVNGKTHADYFTGEEFTAKNILVLKIDYGYNSSNYYLELGNTGKGKGYYITNGYAREITWEKSERRSQTIYKYLDGTEVNVNDGITYIMFHSNSETLNIS